MILDSRQAVPGTAFEADVCIVGAGAAGISMAMALADRSLDVLLLEGGGFTYEQPSQDLYIGPEEGTLIGTDSLYMGGTRLRYFGGTTNHWHGWCRPFDPEDFERREWLGDFEWPISFDDVAPWYPEACKLLQISPFDYDQETAGDYGRVLADDPHFETNFFHLSPPTRFAQQYRQTLQSNPRIRVLLHANVRKFDVDDQARHITGIDVVDAAGSPLDVRARHYVLAAGGIENPRLLLTSDTVAKNGLGNDHGQVGRYFMDHPLQRIGSIVIPHMRSELPKTYSQSFVVSRNNPIQAVVRARPEFQKQHQLMNAAMVLSPMRFDKVDGLTRPMDFLARNIAGLAGLESPEESEGAFYGWIYIHGEQIPNPDSRVRLSRQTDPLGVRRPRLDWHLTDTDVNSLRRTTRLFGERLGARLEGRCSMLPEDSPWDHAHWSNHHIGTTRMSASSRSGVVDGNCRVHGVDNLYVAGSSVFTSSSCSNPTLTLVALSLRLSEHLERTSA